MELRYRGNIYQLQDNQVETIVASQTGRFLGQTYYLRRHITKPIKSHLGIRKYRGVTYEN